MLKDKSRACNNFQKMQNAANFGVFLHKKHYFMGMFWFRQGNLALFISVCVAQIYKKIWKKINANNNFSANTLALAA